MPRLLVDVGSDNQRIDCAETQKGQDEFDLVGFHVVSCFVQILDCFPVSRANARFQPYRVEVGIRAIGGFDPPCRGGLLPHHFPHDREEVRLILSLAKSGLVLRAPIGRFGGRVATVRIARFVQSLDVLYLGLIETKGSDHLFTNPCVVDGTLAPAGNKGRDSGAVQLGIPVGTRQSGDFLAAGVATGDQLIFGSIDPLQGATQASHIVELSFADVDVLGVQKRFNVLKSKSLVLLVFANLE